MKKQLLFLITLFMAAISFSQTFTDNYISYNVTSPTTVEVTDYDDINGSSTVIIPASVNYNSVNYSVTSIKFLAFQNSTTTSVDIPDSIITIGVGAFSGSALDTVTIGNSVANIENSAFYNCSLTNVTIPDSVTSIGNAAFQNNSLINLSIGNSVATIGNWAFTNNQLTTIIFPNSVTSIGEFTFQNNPLTSIVSEATTPPTITTSTTSGMDTFNTDRSGIDLYIPVGTMGVYVTDPGALWTGFNSVTEGAPAQVGDTFVDNFITYEITSLSPNEVEVIDYDNINGPSSVVIPTSTSYSSSSFSVTSIGNSAFYNNNLSSVDLPSSLVSIGDDAFRLNQITSLTIIPNSITSIGARAFRSNLMTSLVIPNGVTYLGAQAFAQNLLTSVDIADSVATIEGFLFWQNNFTDMSNVIFPIGTTIIPEGIFYENPFTNVVIPDGITSIGDVAFEENQIVTVTLPNSLTSIGVQAFKDNLITSITIPDGVVSIGDSAFMINQLTTVVIPENVTNIDADAFKNNPLTDVYSEAITPPTIVTGGGLDTFAEDRSIINLHIPAGTIGAYVTDTGALWTGFNPVTEDALSVSDFELENDIKVVTNTNAIKVLSANSVRLENYTLYNISGQTIATGKESEISTATFSSCIYVLKLDFDKGTVVKKVLVY